MVKLLSDKIASILQLDIVKVFSLTSISTVVKLLAGFVSVKVIAVIIGPSGLALLGQLGNFSTIVMLFASGGINSGVTKYIAEFRDDHLHVKELIGTSIRITIWLSALTGLILIIASGSFSRMIFFNSEYSFVFIIFGVTLVFYTVNSLLLSIVNGFKEFTVFVKISIYSSVFGLIISLILVYFWGVKGALINAVTSQSFLLIVAILLIKQEKYSWFNRNYFFNSYKHNIAKKYLKFTAMTLVSATVAPVSQLIIRTYLITSFSIEEAGYWEAINKLSGMYLMVITSSFGIYYLPRLSELSESVAIKKEIKNALKVIVPLLLIMLPSIFLFKGLVVRILFSSDFKAMEPLFFWQLIGDFFKITSWLIAYLMVAKGMMKLFISTEILFSFLLVLFAYILCPVFGVKGVVMGAALNYSLYLLIVVIFVYKKL